MLETTWRHKAATLSLVKKKKKVGKDRYKIISLVSVINSLSVRHQQLLKLFSCGLEGPDPASVLF